LLPGPTLGLGQGIAGMEVEARTFGAKDAAFLGVNPFSDWIPHLWRAWGRIGVRIKPNWGSVTKIGGDGPTVWATKLREGGSPPLHKKEFHFHSDFTIAFREISTRRQQKTAGKNGGRRPNDTQEGVGQRKCKQKKGTKYWDANHIKTRGGRGDGEGWQVKHPWCDQVHQKGADWGNGRGAPNASARRIGFCQKLMAADTRPPQMGKSELAKKGRATGTPSNVDFCQQRGGREYQGPNFPRPAGTLEGVRRWGGGASALADGRGGVMANTGGKRKRPGIVRPLKVESPRNPERT